MKYQALRPYFFSMVGWLEGSWGGWVVVVGWVGDGVGVVGWQWWGLGMVVLRVGMVLGEGGW